MKNKILLLTFIISASIVFGQSKKEIIETLKIRIDSLNIEIKKSDSNQKQLAVNLENKENELITAKSSLENLNIKTLDLTQKLNLLIDSIEIYRNSISKLTFTRDFSNGNFNDNELMFIINYFKRELKQSSEEGLESKLLIDSTGITVHLEGELGYVPAFNFERNYNKSLAGDLDKDGINEILFNVGVTGGGTTYWEEIYCLKIFPNNNHMLFKIEVPCACSTNYECREPNTEIINVKDNVLIIESKCFLDTDTNCCPSSSIKSRYKFIDTAFLLLN